MCGRSSITKIEKELEDRFGATFYSDELGRYNPLPNFNVAPSHVLPVILNNDPQHFNALRWGFIPLWAKDLKIGFKMINARIETILEKSTFKKAAENKRCIIPADGFYEWKKTSSGKKAFRITMDDESLFAFAGLWSEWKSPDGEKINSFTIITQSPNKLVSDIHDRMPVILHPEQEALWLDNDISASKLIAMIEPYPSELMKAYKVSDRVNKVSNNDSELVKPYSENQGTLF